MKNPNKKKTHCPSGHEYSGANLYVTSDGARKCKICLKRVQQNSRKHKQATLKRKSLSDQEHTSLPQQTLLVIGNSNRSLNEQE